MTVVDDLRLALSLAEDMRDHPLPDADLYRIQAFAEACKRAVVASFAHTGKGGADCGQGESFCVIWGAPQSPRRIDHHPPSTNTERKGES